tara:strand:+ start:3944 stop:4102 length:159 start_codon:yes stop_codon:yes gene_type:complete
MGIKEQIVGAGRRFETDIQLMKAQLAIMRKDIKEMKDDIRAIKNTMIAQGEY